jgi:hypothetical protein
MRVDITSPEEMTEMPKSVTFQSSGLDHEGMTEALVTCEKVGGGGDTIVWFNVSMDDASFVHVFDAGGELGENIPYLGLGGEILWS